MRWLLDNNDTASWRFTNRKKALQISSASYFSLRFAETRILLDKNYKTGVFKKHDIYIYIYCFHFMSIIKNLQNFGTQIWCS